MEPTGELLMALHSRHLEVVLLRLMVGQTHTAIGSFQRLVHLVQLQHFVSGGTSDKMKVFEDTVTQEELEKFLSPQLNYIRLINAGSERLFRTKNFRLPFWKYATSNTRNLVSWFINNCWRRNRY